MAKDDGTRKEAPPSVSGATIQKELEHFGTTKKLRASIHAWQARIEEDEEGRPSIWVWVVLERDGVDFETRRGIRKMVEEQIRENHPDIPSVYVTFRAASENWRI